MLEKMKKAELNIASANANMNYAKSAPLKTKRHWNSGLEKTEENWLKANLFWVKNMPKLKNQHQIQFIIGNVEYPVMDLTESGAKKFRFSNPIVVRPKEKVAILELSDAEGDAIVEFENGLEPLYLYGFYEGGQFLVKQQGMRCRRTSLERLEQLRTIKILNGRP